MPKTDLNIIAKMTSAQIDAGFKKMTKNLNKSDKGFKKNEQTSKKAFGKQSQNNLKQTATKIVAITAALVGMSVGLKKIIEASTEVENLQIRLEVLFGSVTEGNKVFADMKDLAAKVPKTYQEIMQAATMMGGVVENGSSEIRKWMPLIVDLSAATGISVQDVSSQMIKMYSAGASAADMFRDRGVLAMLGFTAGVAVSAADTRKRLLAAFEDPASKFAGASDKLAKTWTGAMSMMGDAMFNLRVHLGSFITQNEDLLNGIRKVVAEINTMPDAIDEIAFSLQRLKEINEEMKPEDTILQKVIGGAQMTNIQSFIELIGFANQAVTSLAEKIVATEFGQDIRAELIAPTPEGVETTGDPERDEALETERIFWEEKAGIVLTGQEQIDAIIKSAMELTAQEKLKNQVAILKIEQQEIDVLLQTAKIKEDIEKKLLARKAQIIEAEKKLRAKAAQENIQTTLTTGNKLLGLLSQTLSMAQGESKKYAGIIQGIALGQAIISTAVAVAKANELGYPMSIPAMALAAATGAVQIATIASQGFAEGTDSVPAKLTSGEMVIPRNFANAVRSGDITIGGRGAGQAGAGGMATVVSPVITIEINNPIVDNDDRASEIADDIALRVSEIIADEEERI